MTPLPSAPSASSASTIGEASLTASSMEPSSFSPMSQASSPPHSSSNPPFEVFSSVPASSASSASAPLPSSASLASSPSSTFSSSSSSTFFFFQNHILPTLPHTNYPNQNTTHKSNPNPNQPKPFFTSSRHPAISVSLHQIINKNPTDYHSNIGRART